MSASPLTTTASGSPLHLPNPAPPSAPTSAPASAHASPSPLNSPAPQPTPAEPQPSPSSQAQQQQQDAIRASPALAPVQEEQSAAPEVSMAVEATPEATAAATLASVAHSLANQQAPAQASAPTAASSSNASPVPSPVPAVPNPLPPGYNKDQPICANCSTQTTPLWRRSHDSTHILCNACALFFKMKGRPRPISLKTDVIKSRNRSKGKSTSKDRAGTSGAAAGGSAKKGGAERSESTSRAQSVDGKGRKSAPGGADEEDELESNDGKDSNKHRRVGPTGYPAGPWPGAPYGAYPHPAHPHAHAPYPPQRSRSRSSSATRRGGSVDGRGPPAAPYGYPPPPAGYEGAAPYPYHYPPGYPGYPGYPGGYYPPPPGAGYPHPHAAAAAAAAAHALAHPPSTITHQQSDSRSNSGPTSAAPSDAEDSPAASPNPSTASGAPHYYPGYHHPYSQSPLHASTTAKASTSAVREGSPRTAEQPNGRVTLAPMVHSQLAGAGGAGQPSSRASTPGAEGSDRVNLPSLGAVAAAASAAAKSATATTVPHRHSALFASRGPAAGTTNLGESSGGHSSTAGQQQAGTLSPNARGTRRASVSSNSPSVSGSSDGVRSPETTTRPQLAWGPPSWLATEDERRGRPEKRFEDMEKGKGRENDEEFDELEEDDSMSASGGRMMGVEAGLGELRVVDHHHGIKTDSSRSRSSGNGREERGRGGGRPSGSFRGRSQSTSRARGSEHRSSSSASGPGQRSALQAAEAEIARLKTKVSELTFLNGLMQSRLGQLEGPGRVPTQPMSFMAPTPAPFRLPDPEDEDDVMEEEENEEQSELKKFGVDAADPAVRAQLLEFFRKSQAEAA